MEDYFIPQKYLPGFETLIELTEEDFEKVIIFLVRIPIGTGPKKFITTFSNEIDNPGSEALASMIYSMGGLILAHQGNLNQLSQGLAICMEKQSHKEITPELLDRCQKRLAKMFDNMPNLIITFKAISLCAENGRTYQDSKIITDIRLIFKEDIKSIDRNAVLIHQLKIQNDENDETNNLYFALNTSELLSLKSQIERAIEKGNQIKESYGESISFIELTD